MKSNKFRILNLNVWNQNYFWEKRYPLISDLIKQEFLTEELPTIVVFHEVTNTAEHSQSKELTELLPDHNSHYFEILKEEDKSYGILIAAQAEIIEKRIYKLTVPYKSKDKFPRVIILTRLKIDENEFILGATHFSVDSETQVKNCRESLEEIEQYTNNSMPIVVCADFNAAPDEKPVQMYRDSGFEDAWLSCGKKDFSSWPTDVDLVIENHKIKTGSEPEWDIKPRRIDYIFTRGFEICNIDKVGKKLVNLWHSDHWGQVAELRFKGES